MFRRLFDFGEVISSPESTSLINLDNPSRQAEKQREKKIAAAKKKLGDKYLNVPFKGKQPEQEKEVSVTTRSPRAAKLRSVK